MENKAVEVRDLAKSFHGFWAVKGISFSVHRGEIFGFLGPNGAGKTTTLRIITGLSRATRGEAYVFGHSVRKEEIWVKEHIGVVPEISNLYPELSVFDNLIFIGQLYGLPKKERSERAHQLLKDFDLEQKRNVLFAKLSKGMKRRLTIAAALIHKPAIIFLDEPTTGLDVASSRHLRLLIKKLHQSGVTIFLTTHNIAEAEQLCQRIAIIVKGKIVALNTTQALKQKLPSDNLLIIKIDRTDKSLRQKLSKLSGVKTVIFENSLIRIQSDDLNSVLITIPNLLQQERVKILSVNTSSPSLEDAFVHLTGLDLELMKIDKEMKS
ncbi:MAG: ABC transporter ATP-binding protein [Candidatus Aminicenantes bacterium]|nr:ABC transporter ATP-binding protein [Candidatus Aminicenantes bacterium]